MKWKIKTFNSQTDAIFLDSSSITDFVREGTGENWRLVTPIGFLDITDFGDNYI